MPAVKRRERGRRAALVSRVGRDRDIRRSKGKANLSEKKKSPGEILRSLVDRAGMSAAQIARIAKEQGLADWSGGNALTNYWQAKSPHVAGGKKIPYRVIGAVSSIIVGKGEPPIRWDELLSISDVQFPSAAAPQFSSAAGDGAGMPATIAKPAMLEGTLMQLPVRYRAEDGVFVNEAFLERSHGKSALLATSAYPLAHQFVAVAMDNHAVSLGVPAGSQVLCVLPTTPGVPEPAPGQAVLVAVPQDDNGARRVIFARFAEPRGGVVHVTPSDGRGKLPAVLLGVPVARYVLM
jgi:hypothetical protein